MKKPILLLSGALLLAFGSHAQQWSGSSGSTGTIYRNGNVGIGHTSNSSVYQQLHLRNPSGNAGIRLQGIFNYMGVLHNHWEISTSSSNSPVPQSPLEIKWGESSTSTGNPPNFTTVARFISGNSYVFEAFGSIRGSSFYDRDNPAYYLDPSSTGTSLKVNGKIISKEIEVVAMNTNSIKSDDIKTGTLNVNISNVADYVFEEDYNLRPLEEVEAFIKENKHLPDLPKGTDLEEKGMDVAQMTNLLLQKIEELTLYVLELRKENKAQDEIINRQTGLIESLATKAE